jgi:hypothetical protein
VPYIGVCLVAGFAVRQCKNGTVRTTGLRFASVGEGTEPLASAQEAALDIRFVAHVFWLDHLWGEERELDVGCDLAALLAAVAESEPRLLWPAHVSREREPGARVAQALQRLQSEPPKRVRIATAPCAPCVSWPPRWVER